MKKRLIFIQLIVLCLLNCSNTDKHINKYIRNNCTFEIKDTCIIDLRKILNIDYDTMWLFSEYTIYDAMRNCLRSETFKPKRPFKIIAIEYDVYSIVLLKKGKIVYNNYINYHNLDIKKGIPIAIQGVFDEAIMIDTAYLYINPYFKIMKKTDASSIFVLEPMY